MKKSSPTTNRGFTLLELLIVIGILAILSAVTIITINPSEYLRRSRDNRRIADLGAINRAISYLQATNPGVSLGSPNTVSISVPDNVSSTCGSLGLPALPSGWTYRCVTAANLYRVDGLGWIPINFTTMAGGSPLASLPVDPTNATSSGQYYTYVTGGSWELNAIFESQRFRENEKIAKRNFPGVLALGSNLNLSPLYNSSGLVGYWKFDEGSGTTAVDSSGLNNNGTLVNSPAWQAEINCKIGQCLNFGGASNNYVSLGNPSILRLSTPFTILAWAFPTASPSNDSAIVAKWNDAAGTSNYLLSYGNTGRSGIYISSTGSGAACTATNVLLSQNNWNAVASVFTGSQTILYINGSSVTNDSCGITPFSGSADARIGSRADASFSFSGRLDDVRIYNRALSPAEIMAIYNATR